jgi:hypothetical protein
MVIGRDERWAGRFGGKGSGREGGEGDLLCLLLMGMVVVEGMAGMRADQMRR